MGSCQTYSFARVERLASYRENLGIKLDAKVFERENLKNGDVVEDVLDRIGFAHFEPQILPAVANESVSAEAMQVLFSLSGTTSPNNLEEIKLQRRLARNVKKADAEFPNPTKPVLHPEVAVYVQRINSNFYALNEDYGLVFSDIDYDALRNPPSCGSQPKTKTPSDLCDFDTERAACLIEFVAGRLRSQSDVGRN